jgi:AcrR family transcriptional regulator
VSRHALEVRQEEILRATVDEISARGLANVRVADVAAKLNISSALVFYHFATKERLIAAAYTYAAEQDLAALAELAAAGGSAVARLRSILKFYLPSRNTVSWELWIDAWSAALRWDDVRRTSSSVDRKWKDEVASVIAAGVAADEFNCADPNAAAWRLTALIDGLAIQLVANRNGVNRKEMGRWVAEAAAAEVGCPVAKLL